MTHPRLTSAVIDKVSKKFMHASIVQRLSCCEMSRPSSFVSVMARIVAQPCFLQNWVGPMMVRLTPGCLGRLLNQDETVQM